jgi:hypothetical protein
MMIFLWMRIAGDLFHFFTLIFCIFYFFYNIYVFLGKKKNSFME